MPFLCHHFIYFIFKLVLQHYEIQFQFIAFPFRNNFLQGIWLFSLISACLGEEKIEYYIVGTAFVYPDETEAKSVDKLPLNEEFHLSSFRVVLSSSEPRQTTNQNWHWKARRRSKAVHSLWPFSVENSSLPSIGWNPWLHCLSLNSVAFFNFC